MRGLFFFCLVAHQRLSDVILWISSSGGPNWVELDSGRIAVFPQPDRIDFYHDSVDDNS